MYYPNRQVLGDQLAEKLTQYKNTDSIIFCLKKSSLVSCIELAAHLHAYVYILQYVEIPDPFDVTRVLGAITQKGDFVLNPAISRAEYDYIAMDFLSVIEERKRDAFSKINAQADPNPNFNMDAFNGRNILLFADILSSPIQIEIALHILKSFKPALITGVCGNITSEISDKFNIETDGVTYMDILPNTFFDDEHYFEQPDSFTEEEKIKMANNISLYWA